jgi:hypothetical protein
VPARGASADYLDYLVLEQRVRVQSDHPEVSGHVAAALHRFAVPSGGAGAPPATTYRVEHLSDPEPNQPPYRLRVGADVLYADADPGLLAEYLLWHVAQSALTGARSAVVVHAGSVVTPGGTGVLLPSASGSGKTTLTAGLVLAGCGFLSDEAAVYDAAGLAGAYPRPLNLKPGSPLLDHPDIAGAVRQVGMTSHLDPDALRPGCVPPEPVRTRLVVLPRYSPSGERAVEPVPAAEAVVELVTQVTNRPVLSTGGFHVLAETVRGAHVYRATYRTLDEGVQTVLGLAGKT